MKNPVLAKILAIVCVLAALIFGLSLIQNLVKDRFALRNAAIASIGSSQILTGPFIHSACVETWEVATKTPEGLSVHEERREFILTALPEILALKSDADIDRRGRSLHQVNTFHLKAKISAKWANLDSLQVVKTVKDSRMNCGAPIMMVSVSDSSGIRSASLSISGAAQTLKPGTFHPHYSRGVHTTLPDALRSQKEPITAEIALELLGTEKLSIVPLGGTTEVAIQGNWPHPSFGGTFLPSERTVGAKGFDGTWRISSLATTVGDSLSKGHPLCTFSDAATKASGRESCVETLAVSFVDPINFYSLSDRATKYGLLFVVLTFVAVGLFEFMQRLRVHPVQYFLVGSAICSFFLLLVSLSEQIGFNMAYAAAASACVLLLMYYASYMLGSVWRGLPFGLMTGLLYGLLYMLLQLEQTALAVGAVALFIVLATIMALTRKVNWYALAGSSADKAA